MRKSVLAVAASASVFAMVVAGAAGGSFNGNLPNATQDLNNRFENVTGTITTITDTVALDCAAAIASVTLNKGVGDTVDTVDVVFTSLSSDCVGFDLSAAVSDGVIPTIGDYGPVEITSASTLSYNLAVDGTASLSSTADSIEINLDFAP